jgi:diacylglycerol kinase family enzyme
MMTLLEAIKKHNEGKIALHKANVAVYMKNPAGIGEHSDIAESVEKELLKIAEAQDVIDMIDKHFSVEEQLPLFS